MGLKYLYLPSGVKAGTAYGVMPNSADADFDDFTRNSTASRIGKNGFIESVGSNVPRLDYSDSSCPSLLLEPQRLNRVTNSDEFTGNLLNLTVNRNQIISPDGSLNADRMFNNNGNGEHFVSNGGFNPSIVNGTDYVASCFFKSDGTGGQGVIRTYVGTWIRAVFNLEEGTISAVQSGSDAKMENYGNGWYRCSLLVTAVGDYGSTFVQIGVGNSLNEYSYQGTSSLGNYFWGVQFEQGSFPTSYIPTNGSAVTRAADLAGSTGDLSDTFNDSEGVLMAEISALADDLTFRNITISDGSNSNIIQLRYRSTSNVLQALLYVGGVGEIYGVTLNDITIFSKALIKYKENDVSFWVNGFEIFSDTLASTFPNGTLNVLRFQRGDGAFPFYGNTKQLRYYDTTDIDLEELTSWDSFRAMAEGQNYVIE